MWLLALVLGALAQSAAAEETFYGYPVAQFKAGGGFQTQPYQVDWFRKFIDNEKLFHTFCNKVMVKALTQMSVWESKRFVRAWAQQHNLTAQHLKFVEMNRAAAHGFDASIDDNLVKWPQDGKNVIRKLRQVSHDECLTAEEQCLYARGLKLSMTDQLRDTIHLNIENCDFYRMVDDPDFGQRECFRRSPSVTQYSELHS